MPQKKFAHILQNDVLTELTMLYFFKTISTFVAQTVRELERAKVAPYA